MEHSKTPWKSNFYTHQKKPSHFWVMTEEVDGCSYVVAEIKCHDKPDLDNTNAQFIVKSCNAHDTLTAKAELLDELVENLNTFENQREGNPQPVLLEFAWNEVITLLSKAKEL